MISSLLNVAYLLPIVSRAFFRPLPGVDRDTPVRIAEAPLACVIPICLTATGCLVLFFFADRVYELAAMIDLKAPATAIQETITMPVETSMTQPGGLQHGR
jgi:multicomponent Na+:H+ antiporter subunit D